LSPERLEEIEVIKKQWARYSLLKHERNVDMLDRIAASQMKALEELRKESEELYQAAVQVPTYLFTWITQ